MKICESISEIERISIFYETLKKNIENFEKISYDKKIVTFFNLLFLNKFNNIFPLSYTETLCYGNPGPNYSKQVVNSFVKDDIIDLIINYKGNNIEIHYCKDSRFGIIDEINFYYKNICESLKINDSIDFKIDNLKEVIEEKYQLILGKLEEIINKDKMLKNNINFMKELMGIEV